MIDQDNNKKVLFKDTSSYTISNEGEIFVFNDKRLLVFYTLDV